MYIPYSTLVAIWFYVSFNVIVTTNREHNRKTSQHIQKTNCGSKDSSFITSYFRATKDIIKHWNIWQKIYVYELLEELVCWNKKKEFERNRRKDINKHTWRKMKNKIK